MSEPTDAPVAQTQTRFLFKRRRWLVLASIVIVLVAVFAWGKYRAHRRELAIQEIERLGGTVELRNRSVVLDWLESLNIFHFNGYPFLVEFHRSEIIDSDLKKLHGLPTLERLVINECGITDAGLQHLIGLKHLDTLSLNDNKITDEGLRHLEGFTQLEYLFLASNKITGKGLIHLQQLTALGTLNLGGTEITDGGLKHLKGLTELTDLSLHWTQISDEGLEHIKGLTNLKILSLSETQVTKNGVTALQKTLPKCNIYY